MAFQYENVYEKSTFKLHILHPATDYYYRTQCHDSTEKKTEKCLIHKCVNQIFLLRNMDAKNRIEKISSFFISVLFGMIFMNKFIGVRP